jgi:hypothetical protein
VATLEYTWCAHRYGLLYQLDCASRSLGCEHSWHFVAASCDSNWPADTRWLVSASCMLGMSTGLLHHESKSETRVDKCLWLMFVDACIARSMQSFWSTPARKATT